jgi:methylated-DNA-[protein]-cysteine S-methyltransferase
MGAVASSFGVPNCLLLSGLVDTGNDVDTVYAAFRVQEGWMAVVSGGRGLVRVVSPLERKDDARRSVLKWYPHAVEDPGFLGDAVYALSRYFAGQEVHFDFELDWSSYSPFLRNVWTKTCAVRYGQVATYGELARRLGDPRAARAVGGALGRNPLSIVVPCHRVVRGAGPLGGNSAPGGISLKEKLLRLEGVCLDARGNVIF